MSIVSWVNIHSFPEIEAAISQRGISSLGFDFLFQNELSDGEVALIINPPQTLEGIIYPEANIDEKIKYFNCLLLSDTKLDLSDIVPILKIPEIPALHCSFTAGNNQLWQNLKDKDFNKINEALDIYGPDYYAESSIIMILTDLLEHRTNTKAEEVLSRMIKNDHVMKTLVKYAIREGNFDLLEQILKYDPKVFDALNDSNISLLALAKYPTYLPYLTTVFNKTGGLKTSMDSTENELINDFINAKYAALSPVFDDPHSSTSIATMEDNEILCCLYMIRALIPFKTEAATEAIKTLLSIPQVKEKAHKPLSGSKPNTLLEESKFLENIVVTELLREILSVKRIEMQLTSQIDSIGGSAPEATHYIGKESAQAANNQTELIKLQKFLTNYSIKNNIAHPTDNLISELQKRYEAAPCVITKDDNTPLTLPLTWEEFKALLLSTNEQARAFKSYFKNIDHTAWRFLHQHNPWMISDSTKQTNSGTYRNEIGKLWLAAQDKSQPPLDGISLDQRINEFIARIADMGRSNNSSGDNGDYPVCEQGMLGHLAFAVTSHPLYRVVSPDEVVHMFHEYLRNVIGTKITSTNQQKIQEIYKKMRDFEDLTPDEIGSLTALNLSEAEKALFVARIKGHYGEAYGSSEAFNLLLERQLSLEGGFNSHFEKHSAVLNLENILNKARTEEVSPTAVLRAEIAQIRSEPNTNPDEPSPT